MANVGKDTYPYGGSWADQRKQQNSNGNGMVGKYTSPMDPMEIWVVVFKTFLIFIPIWGKMNPFFDDHIFQMGWFNHQPEIGYIYVFSVFPQVTLPVSHDPKAARLPKETYALGIVELVQLQELITWHGWFRNPIPNHPGCIKPNGTQRKKWDKLPTSTGERRISEQSTVWCSTVDGIS